MTTGNDFDRRAAAWLADGPNELNDRVLGAALREVHVTHQRRALRVPWRFPLMPALTRTTAIAAVALVAVVGAGGVLYMNSGAGGGQPTPTGPQPASPPPSGPAPSARPTGMPGPSGVATGVNAWLPYTSEQYGITLGYPDTWSVSHPASRPWQPGDTLDPTSPAVDTFFSESQDYRIAFSVWQLQVGPGIDIGSWEGLTAFAESFCREMGDVPCDGIPDRAVPLCLERRDCHAALLVPFDLDQLAYFGDVETGELTIVAVWRMDLHPSSVAYGGSVELLRSILTTMNVWPLGPGQGPGVTDPPGATG
jgi:hypothetical protein